MVEVESVTGKITIDASGAVQGYQQAGEAAQQFGTDAETSSETIDESNQQVVTSTQAVGTATTATTGSFKDAALGSANLATAGISLYYTMDQVEKAQLKLDKANKTSEADAISLKTAQDNYNKSVAQYGPDSQQATDAADKLKVAQDAYDNSLSAIKLDQDHYNETLMMTAVTVIPSLITGISGAVKTYQTLKDLNMGGALGSITDALGNNKGALIAMGAAAAAAFVFYEAFTTKDPTLRAELSLLAGVLIAAAAAQWVLNAAEAFGLSLTVVGIALVAIGAAAAAATYALSSTYGAGSSGSGTSAESSASSTPSASSGNGASTGAGTAATAVPVVTYPAHHQMGVPISQGEIDYFTGMGYKFDNASQTWISAAAWAQQNRGYAGGGMSVTPQLAKVSENGEPEYHIPDSIMKRLSGSTNNFYIDGSRDVDLTASAVAQKLKNAGL